MLSLILLLHWLLWVSSCWSLRKNTGELENLEIRFLGDGNSSLVVFLKIESLNFYSWVSCFLEGWWNMIICQHHIRDVCHLLRFENRVDRLLTIESDLETNNIFSTRNHTKPPMCCKGFQVFHKRCGCHAGDRPMSCSCWSSFLYKLKKQLQGTVSIFKIK